MTNIMSALRAAAVVCVLIGGGVAMVDAKAEAQAAPYGCGCLHNNTQHTVKFRYKWGDGEYTNSYLHSGNQQTLCWKYGAGSTASPPLLFQIDIDLSTEGKAWTTYALTRVQSQSNRCEAVAKNFHYDIGYRPNTNKQFLVMTRRPQ